MINSTLKLLDSYKKVCSLPSDNQAALKLGISRATVSAWRHGRNHAEPESVEAMAKAVGVDPDEWVLRVQADRESTVNPKRAQVWLRCAQRISQSAATVALVTGLAVYTSNSNAPPSPSVYAESGASVYYVK